MSRIIIDVREPFEYMMGHVKESINVPVTKLMATLPKQLDGVSKDTEIIVYCNSGARSSGAQRVLQSYGFTNVVNGINKNNVQANYL